MERCLSIMSCASLCLTVLLVIYAFVPFPGNAPDTRVVKAEGSLIEKVREIVETQFAPGSNRFRAPSPEEQVIWERIVGLVIDGRLNSAAVAIARAGFPFKLIIFTETLTGQRYAILEEDPKMYGWGFYVFDLETKSPLVIEVPHPVSDSNTEIEGIEAFLETRARAFILSGTHRRSNLKESPCTQATEDSDYAVSDPAHNVNTMFHSAHTAISERRPGTVAVQLHGMRERDVCPNVFLSTGTRSVTENASRLLSCLRDKGIETELYGDSESSCPLIASTNVQGRYSNGERRNPCGSYAELSPEPGFFIHAEQEPGIRKDAASWKPVIEALKCAFPDN